VNEKRNKDGDVIYSVPYSEHSSFCELITFLDHFKPSFVVPTVNTGKDAVQEQLKVLKEHSSAYNNQVK